LLQFIHCFVVMFAELPRLSLLSAKLQQKQIATNVSLFEPICLGDFGAISVSRRYAGVTFE
jgi:hypothetical protein